MDHLTDEDAHDSDFEDEETYSKVKKTEEKLSTSVSGNAVVNENYFTTPVAR